VWCDQGTEIPHAYQGPAVAINDVTASVSGTLPRQFNSEGELVATGKSLMGAPSASASLLNVRNGSNNQNRRELTVASSGAPTFHAYDGAATDVTSVGTAFSWASQWEMRCRWCRASTLDNAANPFAGIVVAASVNSAVYGRGATFSESSTQSTQFFVNSGTNAGLNASLQKLAVRAREEKLP
jgi:hypothetical protein